MISEETTESLKIYTKLRRKKTFCLIFYKLRMKSNLNLKRRNMNKLIRLKSQF